MKNEVKKDAEVSDRVLIKKLLGYFLPYTGYCAVLAAAVLASLVTTLLQPVFWSKLIAALFNKNMEHLGQILMVMVFLYLLSVGISFVQSAVTSYLNAKVILSMQDKLFEKMLSMNMEFFDKNQSGSLISRLITDISQVIDTVTKQIVPALISLMKVLVIFVIMIRINLSLTIITVGLLPITLFVYSKNTKKMREKQLDVKNSMDCVVSNLQQAIGGIKNIKSLGLKNIETDLFIEENQKKTKKAFGFSMFVIGFQTILSIIGMLGEVSVYILGGYYVLNAVISVERFIQFASYSQQFGNASLSLVNLIADYQKIIVALRRLYDIEESVGLQHEKFGDREIEEGDGNVEIRNLTYAYGKETIFENLNLSIPANKMTAITGKSGSGKTTIFDLILGLYRTEEGEIRINGIPIKELSEKSLRKYVSIVSQQHFLFNTSILQNFKYVKPGISLGEVKAACHKCEIDEYIDGLPDKYNTVIYENGSNFSIGQLQRLCIARALVKNAKIILFDEPTSALDSYAANKIRKLIDGLRSYKTIVVISHDMEFIKNADKTYQIEFGNAARI